MIVVFGGGEGAELSVTIFPILACPELSFTGPGCVVVGRRRAITLLSVVGARKGDLESGRNNEKKPITRPLAPAITDSLFHEEGTSEVLEKKNVRVDNGDDEGSSLQLAGLILVVSNG